MRRAGRSTIDGVRRCGQYGSVRTVCRAGSSAGPGRAIDQSWNKRQREPELTQRPPMSDVGSGPSRSRDHHGHERKECEVQRKSAVFRGGVGEAIGLDPHHAEIGKRMMMPLRGCSAVMVGRSHLARRADGRQRLIDSPEVRKGKGTRRADVKVRRPASHQDTSVHGLHQQHGRNCPRHRDARKTPDDGKD